MPLESLTAHRHLQLIEGILHHVIRIQLVHLPHHNVHIRLLGLREEQELGPAGRLEAREPEQGRFEHLEAGRGGAWGRAGSDRGAEAGIVVVIVGTAAVVGEEEGCRGEGARDGVHAVEGAG